MSLNQLRQVFGRGSAADGAATSAVLAASAGKTNFVKAVQVSVTVAAAGGGGIVTLRDGTGGTVLWSDLATTAKSFPTVYFGDDFGYPLTSGNGFSLEVSGAVTTQATAIAVGVGYQE